MDDDPADGYCQRGNSRAWLYGTHPERTRWLMAKLPDCENLLVTCDTETSSLHTDDGSRIAVVSYAFRKPTKHAQRGWIQKPDAEIVAGAVAFDQGVVDLPLGEKDLPSRQLKRINKTKPIEAWIDGEVVEVIPKDEFYTPAPNADPAKFDVYIEWLKRQRSCWHNAKFDMQQFLAGLRGREGDASAHAARDLEASFWWDTQLAQAVLDPRFGTSLKPTSERYHLGREVGIAEGHEADEQRALSPWRGPMSGKDPDPRYDLIPWRVMKPYATGDAVLTLLLMEYQGRLLDEEAGHWWSHIARQFDLMIALYRMENRGIGFDAIGCRKQRDRLEIARERVKERLPFDPTPDKARVYFFNDPDEEDEGKRGLGVIPYSHQMTEGGKPQVTEEVIGRLTHHADERVAEVARVYEQHENIKSAISKWYGAWPEFVGEDGRLRTSYQQARVVSGRLSAQRVQLQAIPHDYQLPDLRALGAKQPLVSIREFFVPRKGYQLWELDVANAEPRIATMIARCLPMYNSIMYEGLDTHSAACLLMFRDEIGPDKDGNEFGPDHADWTEYRQVAKRCNLGILYAAGPATIRDTIRKEVGVEYDLSQVKAWVEQYRRAFPQFVSATDYWSKFADANGYVRLINGRLRYFQAHEPLHKGMNQVVQGSVAEIMTDVMIEVEHRLSESMLLQIHDSLVLEVPEDRAEWYVIRCAYLMRQVFEKRMRLRWRPDEPKRHMDFPVDIKPFGRTKALLPPEAADKMQEAIDGFYFASCWHEKVQRVLQIQATV